MMIYLDWSCSSEDGREGTYLNKPEHILEMDLTRVANGLI